MYKTVIGLEVHVQLKTKSKMFCSCQNGSEDAIGDTRYANTRVCPVCLGLPGVLPVTNKQAVEWTLKTGLAMGCKIADFSKFDRKHYFYPDLPKGYQVSQYDLPFCVGGGLEIGGKNIKLRRIHLEEDAGKLIHAGSETLVDLNRAGTPLMEIVTEPDINSPAEAKIFLQSLRSLLRYLDVSDADMEKGHLRADANISISHIADSISQNQNHDKRYATSDKLGTPAEIKNLNSFRMVERALAYEEKRQKEALDKGEKIVKETRGWNDAKGESYSQRSKEQAQDYRYFPEPDLPPFQVHKVFKVEKLKEELPELPAEKLKRYIEVMKLPVQDAEILSLDKDMAEYFEKVAGFIQAKLAANWVINELKYDGILTIEPHKLMEMLVLVEKGEISGKIAKDVLAEMIKTGKSAQDIVSEKGLKTMGDEGELGGIIDKIINDNDKQVAEYKSGKTALLGFFVGKVMQETKGQANPKMVNEILKDRLEK